MGKKSLFLRIASFTAKFSVWAKQGICLQLFNSIALKTKKNYKYEIARIFLNIYMFNIVSIVGNYISNFPSQVSIRRNFH